MIPKDAATLIAVRNRSEVLLGQRSKGHVFMPGRYVFPGGRVDPGDARVACPHPLAPRTEALLTRGASGARARALAMAAIRETWEETGLIAGVAEQPLLRTRSKSWQAFFKQGYVPAVHQLEFIARAVTPPGRVRRFDTRFFLIDGNLLHGTLQGNGELLDLHWAPLAEAQKLSLAPITDMIIELLQHRFPHPRAKPVPQPIPYYRTVKGKGELGYYD